MKLNGKFVLLIFLKEVIQQQHLCPEMIPATLDYLDFSVSFKSIMVPVIDDRKVCEILPGTRTPFLSTRMLQSNL